MATTLCRRYGCRAGLKHQMRPLCHQVLVLFVSFAFAGCATGADREMDQEPTPFTYDLEVGGLDGPFEVRVDGEVLSSDGYGLSITRVFGSHQEALAAGVTIETFLDGARVDTLWMRPDQCEFERCLPSHECPVGPPQIYERSGARVSSAGTIVLGTCIFCGYEDADGLGWCGDQ